MNERIFWLGLCLAWILWLLQGWFFAPVVHASASPCSLGECQNDQPVTVLPLPDLQTLPPFDLQLITNPVSGTRQLRFSNAVANTGAGPLDLYGEMDPSTQTVTLIQQVRGADGTTLSQRLGGFGFHPEHNHWHWQGFSVYEIWTLGLNAELEEAVIQSGKVGYCMLDSSPAEARWLQAKGLAGLWSPTWPVYAQCGWRRQGISVGWMDTYLRDVPGQLLDVSSLADGVYALRSTVDPEGLLAEADRHNNAALVYFRLEGSRLTVIDDERFVRAAIFRRLFGEINPHPPAPSPQWQKSAPLWRRGLRG